MSAKKMVADSTQVEPDPLLTSSKRKKSSQKKKKHQSTKKKKSYKSEDEDSDLDLDKELFSIGNYLNNRQEMVGQMFHSLRGATLKRHIPDILKEMTIEELKEKCVEHLEVMSKKRIQRILAGDDPANISSSSTEDENSDEENNYPGQQTEERPYKTEENIADSTSPTSSGIQGLGGRSVVIQGIQGLAGRSVGIQGLAGREVESGQVEATGRQAEEEETPNDIKSEDGNSPVQQESDGEEGEDGGELSVNQMELLELEMRARAIKAMLLAQEQRDKQS
ncbi:caspase activity and apoptosis inhibitor 1-like isoform X1 [Ostrea edulis]|uniref:caspase activity and apoptosis inhibitor 1-like isoform X1 n=1 Tax=Ostrea edulis TaxID=37623 RepID=UPI0020963F75|nr:caspase activity and apoptosis inhibitor 1-like isoform X1 [Ostrea edulis]XP_048758148.1 caspase activity and apoptosis inhibitor 1-like isoform X1 [Ostrea edulis]XP_048758149.1 caspase activity and apoptosis inhibitor 1-like isoform X1 [Ostrea edulis]XP_048758153.1 caspase activity and apoptosis inhibitor 1-like isoform X1 [Ostrea edulis]XP_048758154.1 caspase activity and apoptosis inhibitor 1-like isoform X1 [Ostrea edulis]XP_048758155.1 caspase activity and apoptosis inhibitor 1-like is